MNKVLRSVLVYFVGDLIMGLLIVYFSYASLKAWLRKQYCISNIDWTKQILQQILTNWQFSLGSVQLSYFSALEKHPHNAYRNNHFLTTIASFQSIKTYLLSSWTNSTYIHFFIRFIQTDSRFRKQHVSSLFIHNFVVFPFRWNIRIPS